MYTTIQEVKELTGYDVEQSMISMAQSIIEVFTGKVEAEVVDANDQMLLGKATAYQAAYMNNDTDKIFEQMNVGQIMQFGQMITFKQNDNHSPWVAPLAALACQRLSWKRIRSVKTGSIFDTGPRTESWRSE